MTVNKIYVYPYKAGSKSAKALGYRRIKHTNSNFRHTANKTVINWGATELNGDMYDHRVLNQTDYIVRASNKLSFLQYNKEWEGCRVPMWTNSREEARQWIEEGRTVLCRTLLRASGGRGITIATTVDELVDAPLYVQYKKKTAEFRIHIFQGDVFHTQRKVRDNNVPDEEVCWKIRNHDNGFIFQINNLDIPEDVIDQALKAFNVSGLDFGAVDVIWNRHEGKAYVLEINTAPGLTGTTLEKYQEVFNNYDRRVR